MLTPPTLIGTLLYVSTVYIKGLPMKDQQIWDVIVVGARCSGATLATLLARKGLKTLMLDSSKKGTDSPLSTHFIQPKGIDVLDRLGLGKRIREITPPSPRVRIALNEVEVISEFQSERAGFCIRRLVIDTWLQETAEASGVTFKDQCKVKKLIMDGERVAGVIATTFNGDESFNAKLVVGADGSHSTIAKLTGVETYLETEETQRGAFWGYFPAPDHWDANWDSTLNHTDEDLRYVFRCDTNLVLMVYYSNLSVLSKWGKNKEELLIQALKASPITAKILGDSRPVGKVRGILKNTFFYRRPVGPGFALVGDAGHFKSFITGQGISDALIDAENLADAIVDGRPEAYEYYWRSRDIQSLPLHFDSLRQGSLEFNTPLFRWLLGRMNKNATLRERVCLITDREISPNAILPPTEMVKAITLALLKGKADVLRGIGPLVLQLFQEGKILRYRRQLLTKAKETLDDLPLTLLSEDFSFSPVESL